MEGEGKCFINDPGANQRLSFDHIIGAIKRVRPSIFYVASGIFGGFDLRVWDC